MQVERYSRKRGRSLGIRAALHRDAAVRRRKLFRSRRVSRAQRGYLRTGGNYGRYAPGGTEMKFNDATIDDAAVVANGTIQNELLEIAEGVGEEQRVGRKITIRKCIYRFTITIATTATAANTTDTVRLMIVQDKQANGAMPTVANVLQTDFYLGLNNLANSARFRTLFDKFYDLNCIAGSGQNAADIFGASSLSDQVYLNVNIPIEYDNSAATGDITTIRSNNIFMIWLSKLGHCAVVGRWRVRYSDR